MGHENDFSWNVKKSVSNEGGNRVTPIVSGPAKVSMRSVSSHSDAKAEMEELFEEFKHRIADIMSRETNEK